MMMSSKAHNNGSIQNVASRNMNFSFKNKFVSQHVKANREELLRKGRAASKREDAKIAAEEEYDSFVQQELDFLEREAQMLELERANFFGGFAYTHNKNNFGDDYEDERLVECRVQDEEEALFERQLLLLQQEQQNHQHQQEPEEEFEDPSDIYECHLLLQQRQNDPQALAQFIDEMMSRQNGQIYNDGHQQQQQPQISELNDYYHGDGLISKKTENNKNNEGGKVAED
jgi:hypothetical protein